MFTSTKISLRYADVLCRFSSFKINLYYLFLNLLYLFEIDKEKFRFFFTRKKIFFFDNDSVFLLQRTNSDKVSLKKK
jgi:hypothetical protein